MTTTNKIAVLALLVLVGLYMYATRETIRASFSAGFQAGSQVQASKVVCWQDPGVPGVLMSFDPRTHAISRGCPRVLEWRNEELRRASL
jgi:hypothetical protein